MEKIERQIMLKSIFKTKGMLLRAYRCFNTGILILSRMVVEGICHFKWMWDLERYRDKKVNNGIDK